MPQPRFLFLATSSAGLHAPSVAWRLVAGNNHALGRSAVAFDAMTDCRAAVDQLRERADVASVGLSPDSRPGRWGWQVTHLGQVLAVSSRVYERQREARYSLTQFLAAVPVATVVDTVALRPVPRELRRGAPPAQPAGGHEQSAARPAEEAAR